MHKIEKAKYEGYIWMSDSKKPTVYTGKTDLELSLNDSDNPFIIEGNLWNKEKRESIKVAYIDGKYRIRHTIVSEDAYKGIDDSAIMASNDAAQMVATTKKEYFAHCMPGIEKLCFVQYWEAEEDPMCENMKVLAPTKLVFVGFKKEED